MAIQVTVDGYLVEVDTGVPASPSDLDTLLSSLPGYSIISDSMKSSALSAALIPDSNGVWPYQVGYVSTYDMYFAAIRLIGFLQAQPVVRQTSSEGTSVAVDAPNWGGIIAYYRSMSPILSESSGGVLHKVLIPDGPHVDRVPMGERGDGYDDVDTDLD